MTDINECQSNPCIRGTCYNLLNEYSCYCPKGFTGTQCETGKFCSSFIPTIFNVIFPDYKLIFIVLAFNNTLNYRGMRIY